jgi:membrane-bound lytic murein transglycosylase MltF
MKTKTFLKCLLCIIVILLFVLPISAFHLTSEEREILESYESIHQEIITDYQSQEQAILKIWGEFKKSVEKEQVIYSEDLKVRSIINYETGIINIQITNKAKVSKNEHLNKIHEMQTQIHNMKDAGGKRIFAELPETVSPDKIIETDKYYDYKLILPTLHLYNRYLQYKNIIDKYSVEFQIPNYLIVSVIKNESSFNPYACSHVAYGLMQIVPKTGGRAAHKHIYGNNYIPTIAELYEPEKNIKYGVAYLKKLKQRYFYYLNSFPEIQEMCLIAAYNAGPDRVIRIIQNVNINNITTESFYNYLHSRLPVETQNYLAKNLADIKKFKSASM